MTFTRRTALGWAAAGIAASAVGLPAGTSQAEEGRWEALRSGGHIVLMRHALAPGTLDPPNFRLDDCATQRNLSERGRAQAARAGERFRAEAVPVEAVYSSRWCRCLETAELLALGPIEPLDALNSQLNLGRGQARALASAIAARGPDRPTAIYVTHSSNIRGLLRARAASGEAIVARVAADGSVATVGSLGVL